ncbi:MAG: hypothetical protein E6713_02330 [Sporomusaceae bacterium]|nr:hypothetical protein [Sporomusaceae bacterium]
MRCVFLLFLVFFLASPPVFANSLTGTTSYEYTKQAGQSKQLTQDITASMTINATPSLWLGTTVESNHTNGQNPVNTVNDFYLRFHPADNEYTIGKQSCILGNGLIASISGATGIQTYIKTADHQTISLFYGKKSRPFTAIEISPDIAQSLTVELSYFREQNSYVGLTAQQQLSPRLSLTVDVATNLTQGSKGYLITLAQGDLQVPGSTLLSVEYHNIAAGAVSAYCTDSTYDNSTGLHLELNRKIGANSILTIYRDFSRSFTATRNAKTYLALSNVF